MSGGHHRPFDGPLRGGRTEQLPAQCKIAGALLFVLAVVATPREAVGALLLQGVIVLASAAAVGLRPRTLARRLVVVVPFIVFALLLPVVAAGERTEVLGVSLSISGLWSAWNVIAKGVIGVGASAVLAVTTPVPAMLAGLDRLHVPRPLVAIGGFMLRYGDLLVVEARRMRVARLSRGHDPRWFWEARAVATSAGTLFLRSYERGERVHLAMQSRGFSGTMPRFGGDEARGADWAVALLPALLAGAFAFVGWSGR